MKWFIHVVISNRLQKPHNEVHVCIFNSCTTYHIEWCGYICVSCIRFLFLVCALTAYNKAGGTSCMKKKKKREEKRQIYLLVLMLEKIWLCRSWNRPKRTQFDENIKFAPRKLIPECYTMATVRFNHDHSVWLTSTGGYFSPYSYI